MQRESVGKTLLVATALCVVCSVLVSSAAVGLRPAQTANKVRDQKKNILEAAGLYEPGMAIEEVYQSRVEPRVVDLESGEFVPASKADPATFDQRAAAKDPARNVTIDPENDIAGIKHRAKRALVYLIRAESGDSFEKIVLPVHGKGLWSTLYGFLALDTDFKTIRGLTFYEHGETPGLGGEVDNPNWKALWDGKQAFDDQGDVQIQVIRGEVSPDDPARDHKVDGIAGATITCRGVSHLVQYWLDDNGFGPFLEMLKTKGI